MATFKTLSKEGVNIVEIEMQNEIIRVEAGAMRYYLGDIEMESTSTGGVGGFFKAALSGETFFKPTYKGTGKLVLEPSMHNFFELELNNEEYILDQGAFWAAEDSIEISAHRNEAIMSMFSGEGWFQTSAKGTGTVIVRAPGPVEIIDMKDDKLVVDGSFAVARSSTLNYSVAKSTKSILGSMTSGEGIVNTIQGTGRVYIAPLPNYSLMLQDMMRSLRPSK
ncbi:MAG: AIM24 family protein [Candidatus Cloacimonetes bacterium]|nr:AIM24 family protein [Candidatus Cloacimonadota bacterium]